MNLREEFLAVLNRLNGRMGRNSIIGWGRRSKEAHEIGKCNEIAWDLGAELTEIRRILRRLIVEASKRSVSAFIWESLIGHAHFDVVGFAPKDHK